MTQEVRKVQQEDVQRVTVDPLAAVQQPAQLHDFRVHRHAAGIFDGIARTHLVRHRADPADPRGQVGRFGMSPSTQERLEEPRRLVDVQLCPHHGAVAQRDVQCAFTFHAGQGADRQRAYLGVHRSFRSASKRVTLNVENTLSTSPSVIPSRRNNGMSAAEFGVAAGPKHP